MSQWPHYAISLESSSAPAVSATTAALAPAPSHLIAPLTSTFLIMMASAPRYGTAITPSAGPAPGQQHMHTSSDWNVLDSPLLRQGMERLAHRSMSQSRIHNNPYIVLVRTYLRSLLPQGTPSDSTSRSPPNSIPPIGAQFLSALLDMWLTDIDMPNPSTPQKTPAAWRRGSPSAPTTGRLANSPSAPRVAADFTVPSTLLVTAIKVRCHPLHHHTACPRTPTHAPRLRPLQPCHIPATQSRATAHCPSAVP